MFVLLSIFIIFNNKMFKRMCRDNCLHHAIHQYDGNLVIFYMIYCMCRLVSRTATKDVCVTLTPILDLAVPPHKRSKYIFVPIFLLVTSYFMFWTYQSLK